VSAAAGLDRAVAEVVASGNCSGCGACTIIDAGLSMRLADDGYSRPVRTEAGQTPPDAARTFAQVCPGRRVRARREPEARRHPLLGPVVSCWEAWAADDEVRTRGSSGGTLTALSTWLLEEGLVDTVSTVRVDETAPRRTVPVTITTRDEALASAGSRYAPVSSLRPGALEPGTALVGKPCEASAARELLDARPPSDGEDPLLLSFFCAGTPSQGATDRLVTELGLDEDVALSDLWYRGRGWPGSFTAVAADGRRVSTSYDESWGTHLGRATQWRCKICPDGVGESADISAADFWRTDERGYPVFTEGQGCSALLARTVRGHEVLQRAFAAGVLVGRPLEPDAVAGVQPLQTSRRETLFGRLVGTVAAGRRVPRYVGFGLARLAAPRARETARTARASFGRVRRARATTAEGRR
jgi:coenzyme F420 hydrogenase subunit beta